MKKRNSNIELLRIISIIFIVISHYSVHNGIINSNLNIGLNRFILEISTLGNIGVIIFILISGYFMIESKNIKLKKILRLIFQVQFYSIIIYTICTILGKIDFSFTNMIKSILPITFKEYWFATAYIVLYLISPFLNQYLNKIDITSYKKYIIFMIFWVSVLPTFTSQDFYSNEIFQFILFYSIGGYIRKYGFFNKKEKLNNVILYGSFLLIILSVITIDLLSIKIPFLNTHSTYFFNRYSILAIAFSISLFNVFIKMPNQENKLINFISGGVFGVYLIHDNKYLRNILWNDIVKNKNFVTSNYLLIHLVITISIVIAICIVIELIRKYVIEKNVFKYLDKYLDKLENKIKKISNKYI